VKSAFGSSIDFSLVYNSYNADGSRAQIDSGLGYGWTHSYNTFLFNLLGNMFRMDGTGRITKYQYQHGGTFVAAAGYFETLTNNLDGTFTILTKDGTRFLFAQVPNTPFLFFGPVYRLISTTDRNHNVTTVSYDSAGNLSQVQDTYGRKMIFTYDSHHHLAGSTDPLGRTTTYHYDSTGTRLIAITDPQGKTTQYVYNPLSQLTRTIDKDGRVFTYSYAQMEPTGIRDGAGALIFSFSNALNWATDPTSLAQYQLRVYVPSTTSKTDGKGNVWQYSYDLHGYVTKMVAPDGATTSYTYDPTTLQLASMTDADGHTSTYS
jgi:YD repeat-containing protein